MLYIKKGLMNGETVKYTTPDLKAIFYGDFKKETMEVIAHRLNIEMSNRDDGDRDISINILAVSGKKNIDRIAALTEEINKIFTECNNDLGIAYIKELHHILHS